MWAHGIQTDEYAARLRRIEERLHAGPAGGTTSGAGEASAGLDGDPS